MSEKTDPAIREEATRQIESIRRGTVDFIGEEELRARLEASIAEGRPLRVKLGCDPSSPDLHLGHTVVLNKLRLFQELGHTPIFLIGDFTARIGDPSGKKKTRPALSSEEIEANAATYVAQVSKVLDVDAAEVRFNSEWMSSMAPEDFVRLCSHMTVARLLERDDFAKRYKSETPISVHEFLYPFVQGYDSVVLNADVEIGGTDQTFNLIVGRDIQRAYGQPSQAVLTHPLLVGTSGVEKMSKSLGNSIAVLDPPEEMYGKIMSISDALMVDYLKLLGGDAWDDLGPACAEVTAGGGDPLGLKQELARRVVGRFHGDGAGDGAEAHFRRVVQDRGAPAEVPVYAYALSGRSEAGLLESVTDLELLPSRSEVRRLIAQGGVQIDGERAVDPLVALGPGSYLLKLGRRLFAQVDVT